MSSHTHVTLSQSLAMCFGSAGVVYALCTWDSARRRRSSWHHQQQRRNPKDADIPYHSGQGDPLQGITTTPKRKKTEALHALYHHERLPTETIVQRAHSFRHFLAGRRTLRFFSKDPVPRCILEDIIATAGTSPSGAHKQPWHFCLVGNPTMKQTIRTLVEKEEQINYERRMKQSWVDDLQDIVSAIHSTTDTITKPYLTEAPWLLVVFKQPFGIDETTGEKVEDHYYVPESVGIACGLLIAAIHNANLVTLTSTPMGAGAEMGKLLQRPKHEKVFLLLPIGFPARTATVPYRRKEQERKPLGDIMTVF